MNQFNNHQTNGDDCRESGAGETRRYEMRIIHMSITPSYRLRLEDGTCVFMSWHNYCGPTFYHDKMERRLIDEWYENPLIVKALDWFIGRGERA